MQTIMVHTLYNLEFGEVAHGPLLPGRNPSVEDENACIKGWLKMGMSLAAMEYLVACRPDLDDYLPRMRLRVKRSTKYRGLE